ncbi:transcriptional regulator (plasmid) [Actinomadura graeca]|uniref:Transcriptional regulator n=1 Tax=Actinomadura graeca TaxID=2750812 RepID=A0ABX8RBD2_9ACTN|nr:transcriptional regulator [Actinomadura graeca]QXJ27072.1 transcriptional regulator [Actinomadura graeca]
MTAATDRAARAGLVFLAWHAAHGYADHIGQRPHDAEHKGDPGWPGRIACARHVAGLTATKAVALGLALAATGVRLNPRSVAAAMAADAITHYVIDRRAPLARFAEAIGKGGFYRLGDPKAAPVGTGAYAMDQAAHDVPLAAASVLAALG